MQREAGGAGRQNPAQALVGLPAQSQDKPGTGVSIFGEDGGNPARLPTPSSSVHPHHAGVHWRLPGAQRARKWQSLTLSFSLEVKYLLPGDPPRGTLQGGRVG